MAHDLQRAVIAGPAMRAPNSPASLRQEGWDGEIVLIGEESALPYQRPPLSKGYLADKARTDELAIRSAKFTPSRDPTPECDGGGDRPLGWSSRAEHRRRTALRQARAVHWGPPSTAFHPGADLVGVYLRTAADVEMIREATSPGRRAVIIGGGYIGLETAASLRALGLEVTVLEATGRVLERVTAPLYRRSSTGSTGRRA